MLDDLRRQIEVLGTRRAPNAFKQLKLPVAKSRPALGGL